VLLFPVHQIICLGNRATNDVWLLYVALLVISLFIGHLLSCESRSWFPEDATHLVFIGDSVMRYSYLDFVYRLHFHQDPPINLTCNDDRRARQRWEDYLVHSTSVFKGAMVCDCFRSDSQNVAENMTEIRHYRHPSGKLFATFYLKLGDFPVFGKKDVSNARIYSSLKRPTRTLGSPLTSRN
jgi:hypothetical protein